MEKKIVIIEKDGMMDFNIIGFSNFEAMGILRYAEKRMWLAMVSKQEKKDKKDDETKDA